jgi:hypothetical protein
MCESDMGGMSEVVVQLQEKNGEEVPPEYSNEVAKDSARGLCVEEGRSVRWPGLTHS